MKKNKTFGENGIYKKSDGSKLSMEINVWSKIKDSKIVIKKGVKIKNKNNDNDDNDNKNDHDHDHDNNNKNNNQDNNHQQPCSTARRALVSGH